MIKLHSDACQAASSTTSPTAPRFPETNPRAGACLLEKISEAARAGVDYIQLREKDLPTRELESLAREAVHASEKPRTGNRELRTALSDQLSHRRRISRPSRRRSPPLRRHLPARRNGQHGSVARAPSPATSHHESPLIGVSCHSPAEVAKAAANGATFAVFAPVFEKKDATRAWLNSSARSLQSEHSSPRPGRNHS